MDPTSRLRHPNRVASQPVSGIVMAVATRLNVMVQAIWSWVADNAPFNCGISTETTVTVMPNNIVANCTVTTSNKRRKVRYWSIQVGLVCLMHGSENFITDNFNAPNHGLQLFKHLVARQVLHAAVGRCNQSVGRGVV